MSDEQDDDIRPPRTEEQRRRDAIHIVCAMYPPDGDTIIGRELLEQAKHEHDDWRKLPIEVLERLAYLNQAYERQQIRDAERKARIECRGY